MKLAEYIWIDGTQPTSRLRSKTRVLQDDQEPDIWGFDGSSTEQAEGINSDCVLFPVMACNDPIRRENSLLVLCEVYDTDLAPHSTNTRALCREIAEQFVAHAPLFGLEQEYTFYKGARPLGFPPKGEPDPQGKYYCSVGADAVFGREVVEEHLDVCLRAGLAISGVNAEVMPGQWEFQIGPLPPIETGDHLWMARYLLQKIAEKHGVTVSFDPKPEKGDWNGAGCHTNFSTHEMRESFEACKEAAEALGKNTKEHIANYGAGIKKRLTGKHETCSYKEYKWGVSDRTASVRIPWQVAKMGKGYIEDRRPNANCDPYVVTKLILNTVCSKEEE
jgi:glutamine synthetase